MAASEGGSGYSRRGVLRGAAGIAAAGVLGAAGCGSNTGRSGGGTLTQWYHQYGEPGVQQAVQRYAKAYPKATVTVQWNAGDYDQKLASGLLSSSGPDAFEGQLNGAEVNGGQVMPLDDIIGSAKSDFTPAALACNTFKGKLYAIPMLEDMQLLYYRKSMLAKAGIAPPTTMPALVDAAKRLTNKTVKGLFLGNNAGTNVIGGPVLWSVGLDLTTPDHKTGIGDPALAVALAAWRELVTSNSLLLGAPTDWSDPSAFTQGLCAMQWTGLWVMPAVQKALGDDFGVLPWPKVAEPGAASVPIGTWGAMVNAHSKKKDAAKDFTKWLWVDKTEYQRDFALSYGFHLPVRRSIASGAKKLRSGPAADAVKLSQESAKAVNRPDWTPEMSTAYTDALNRVIRQGADAGSQMQAAGATVQKALDALYK